MDVTEAPLSERLREAALSEFMGAPISQHIGFRAPVSMSVGLRKCALANEIELSTLIRALIRAGAQQYGIDLSHTAL